MLPQDFRLKNSTSRVFQPLPEGWTAFVRLFSSSPFVAPQFFFVVLTSLPISASILPSLQAYTLTGTLSIDGKPYAPSTTVVLTSSPGQSGVELSSVSDEETRFVLIAGEPLDQPVVVRSLPPSGLLFFLDHQS
jgi:hypothetical protein